MTPRPPAARLRHEPLSKTMPGLFALHPLQRQRRGGGFVPLRGIAHRECAPTPPGISISLPGGLGNWAESKALFVIGISVVVMVMMSSSRKARGEN